MQKTELQYAFRTVVRYLFPSICMVCGRVLVPGNNCGPDTEDLQICSSCLADLPLRLPSERWFPCLSDEYEGDPIPDFAVWALFHYEMPVTMILRNLKFHSKQYCGDLISELIGREFPKDAPEKWDAVVPVPLSDKRLRKRGFNQSEVLAQRLSRHLGIPLCNNVIRRTKHTQQQSRFSEPGERAKNVRGAFAIDGSWDITGWNILLVDDILTTGATLHEAARVLIAAGASNVVGVVAATHRENGEN